MATIHETTPHRHEAPQEPQEPLDRIIRHVIDPQSPLAFAARDLEADLFVERGYAEAPGDIHKEYAPYLNASLFEVIIEGDEPVGMVRIITNGPAGFKTINDAESGRLEITTEGQAMLDDIDPDDMAEVGAVAIDKVHRGRDAGRALTDAYGALRRYCVDNKVGHLIASMDEQYFETFKAVFGDTVVALGPMVDYMGSRTVPLLMYPIAMVDSLDGREGFQDLHNQIMAAQERVV